jgi:hypothetical protein
MWIGASVPVQPMPADIASSGLIDRTQIPPKTLDSYRIAGASNGKVSEERHQGGDKSKHVAFPAPDVDGGDDPRL